MKPIIHFPKITILGMNPLGCALGMAVKQAGIADQVAGIGEDQEGAAQRVKDQNAFDEWTFDLKQGISDCDFLILNLPVEEILHLLPQIAVLVKAGCIVIDTGILKKDIVYQATAHFGNGRFFVGSHPMIGIAEGYADKAGEIDFKNKTAYVTFISETDRTALTRTSLFWKALGMVPFLIDPARHDHYMALASHNPSFKKTLEERNLKEWMEILSSVPEL